MESVGDGGLSNGPDPLIDHFRTVADRPADADRLRAVVALIPLLQCPDADTQQAGQVNTPKHAGKGYCVSHDVVLLDAEKPPSGNQAVKIGWLSLLIAGMKKPPSETLAVGAAPVDV